MVLGKSYGFIYKTNKSIPCRVEYDKEQEVLDMADEHECLWVVVGNVLLGKTIMGTWAKV